jgi:uncharacterized protein (DUF58 family)
VALLPFSIYLLANFLTQTPEELSLNIERTMVQTRFQEGEHIEVTLEIENTGEKNIELLEIKDELPNKVSLKAGSNYLITTLRANEKTTVNYKISLDHRGRISLGPTKLQAKNFFRSSFYTKVDDSTEMEITVVPRFTRINKTPFQTKFPKIVAGAFHSKLKGEGLDFSGVREYQTTDSFKRINWHASARYNKLFTNEYELFRAADILLILDATQKSGSVLDESIKAILSLTEYFTKHRCRVGLIVIRDTTLVFHLSSSREQLVKITEKMIDIEPTVVNKYKVLRERLITTLKRQFPPNCLTIIFSPLIDRSLNKILLEVMRFQRNCMYLSPSIISNEWSFIKNKRDPANLLIHQDLTIQRERELMLMGKLGALIIDWDMTVPFAVFMDKLQKRVMRTGWKIK